MRTLPGVLWWKLGKGGNMKQQTNMWNGRGMKKSFDQGTGIGSYWLIVHIAFIKRVADIDHISLVSPPTTFFLSIFTVVMLLLIISAIQVRRMMDNLSCSTK